MRKLLIICLLTISFQVFGQKIYTELYGFKLGQFRETAKNELGSAYRSGKFEDGFEYEIYLLKPDTSLYIAFEFAAGKTNVIWSIQVSGSNSTTDIGFNNLKLGVLKNQVKNIYGKPSTIDDIGDYGNQWNYAKSNYSFEISRNGKLSSVKIVDNSSELFNQPDLKKIPTFDVIQKTLNSNNNVDILNLLAGDVEIYKNDSTFYLKKSVKTEASTDFSRVISLIRLISNDLSTLNTKNIDEYEENMRFALGEETKHVIKIKKKHVIKEMVLKYYFGKYVIWEIKT